MLYCKHDSGRSVARRGIWRHASPDVL